MAAALSLALLIAYAGWFAPGWPLLAGYTAVAVLATLSVPLVYRLSGQTLADELDWLERREANEHAEMSARLTTLRGELAELGIDEGERQARLLGDLLDDYHAVVETRFLGSKSGPVEYLTTARRVQKLAVQNLTDMVATGHSLVSLTRADDAAASADTAIDKDRSADRAEGRAGGDNDDDARLARRGAQTDQQRQRLDSLLDENRQLFDALSDTAVEVANISSFSRYERLDTLARLTSLAEIASRRGGQ